MTNAIQNVVFLDCETSGVTNGREPACRYYLNRCIDGTVKEADEGGGDVTAAKLRCIDGILRSAWQVMLAGTATNAWETTRLHDSFNRILQDFIPAENAQNAHLKRFVSMGFDQAFSQFWRQTEQITLMRADRVYTELYRDALTRQALETLSQWIPWKFLKGDDGSLHFYYDEPVDGAYARAEGVELIKFDAGQKAHIDEVVRACFGPAVLSICMLQTEVDGAGGGISITQDPYYEVFRQHEHYIHSPYAEAVHRLTAEQVRGGREIAELHEKLRDIVQRGEVTFVAHNAGKDRLWILQSIEGQIKYLQYTDCKRGGSEASKEIAALNALMHGLMQSQWFCTQYGDLDIYGNTRSKNGSLVRIMDNRGDSLQSVYERVSGRALQGQHDARVDTYACAVIFCRLLMLNQGVNVEASDGYAKLQAMLETGGEGSEKAAAVSETKKSSSVETLLSRIMRLLDR